MTSVRIPVTRQDTRTPVMQDPGSLEIFVEGMLCGCGDPGIVRGLTVVRDGIQACRGTEEARIRQQVEEALRGEAGRVLRAAADPSRLTGVLREVFQVPEDERMRTAGGEPREDEHTLDADRPP